MQGGQLMTLDKLKNAIEAQKMVSFTYNKLDGPSGKRYGNPHAIYIIRKIDDSESTKVDIVQVGGVSESKREFPSFRTFDLDKLEDVEMDDSQEKFTISEQYNPVSDRYKFVICKV